MPVGPAVHSRGRRRHREVGGGCQTCPVSPRFLHLTDVAEVLNISAAQTYALVRSGELPAIKIGGRGTWRVEASELETYIERMYSDTRTFVRAHPFGPPATD
jgi:excisionase family DNA binding protein